MHLRVQPSDKARQLLLLHGAPRALLHEFALDLRQGLGNLEIVNERRNRIIIANQQLRWFQQIYKNLPVDDRVIVCASQDFYLSARRSGLVLFWRYLEYSLNYPRQFHDSTPIWYTPDLGFNNTLLDAYKEGQHSEPNLVLVDNIYDNMPGIKLDKVHDVMQQFCDRPRLLIIRSADPYNYCLHKLGVRPNQLLFFARSRRQDIV